MSMFSLQAETGESNFMWLDTYHIGHGGYIHQKSLSEIV